MKIIKQEKVYTIIEQEKKWIARQCNGNLSVDYNIPKDLCKTENQVQKYILKSEMF